MSKSITTHRGQLFLFDLIFNNTLQRAPSARTLAQSVLLDILQVITQLF